MGALVVVRLLLLLFLYVLLILLFSCVFVCFLNVKSCFKTKAKQTLKIPTH